jgi:hypothetical protein
MDEHNGDIRSAPTTKHMGSGDNTSFSWTIVGLAVIAVLLLITTGVLGYAYLYERAEADRLVIDRDYYARIHTNTQENVEQQKAVIELKNDQIESSINRITELQRSLRQAQNAAADAEKEAEEARQSIAIIAQANEEGKDVTPSYYKNYYPVQYRYGSYQKVAQSFVLDEGLTIHGIRVEPSFGIGGDIRLSLYRLSEDPEARNVEDIQANDMVATALTAAFDIVKQQPIVFRFEGDVDLVAGQEYIFVVETSDTTTQTSIAFADTSIDAGRGDMYVYTRLVGGNGQLLDSSHSWQKRAGQDIVYALVQQ